MHGRTIAWLNPRQVPLIAAIADAAGLELIGAGGPKKGRTTAIAQDLGVEHVDDLRAVLATADADLVLIADPGDFATGDSRDDAAVIHEARQRGLLIATLEPIPPTALDLAAGGWLAGTGRSRPIDAINVCPLARHSGAFQSAAEAIRHFSPCHALAIESWRTPVEGSLGAALFAAADLVLNLMGEPESIDAAYTDPAGSSTTPGETLRGLHGVLTANLRFAHGRIGSLIVGDNAARWNHSATLLGEAGRLCIRDDGFEWIEPGGTTHERDSHGSTPPTAAHAIAGQLMRILDPATPEPAPTDHAAILALAHAAVLSARTGHPESPATVRQMARAE